MLLANYAQQNRNTVRELGIAFTNPLARFKAPHFYAFYTSDEPDATLAALRQTASFSNGYGVPYAWSLAPKAGGMASTNHIYGAGTVSASALAVKLAEAIINGTGELTATGGLIVQALADLTGSGAITDADVKAFLSAVASISGTGTVSAGDLEGLGAVLAALVGSGTAAGSTATGTGELSADLVVTGTGLTTGNVGAAVWQQIIEAGFSAEQILRILAAQAAGAATGLEGANPQFTGLDGVTVRIDGTYSGGTRTIDSLDGG